MVRCPFLGPDLSLPALRASWGSRGADRHTALAAWSRSQRAETPGREQEVYPAATQREAAAYLGTVVDRLSAIPIGDPDWAAAARDTAGILANLAARLEPNRPGPLSRASDRMAQAAKRPGGTPPGPQPPGLDLSGVAAVAAQAMLPGGPAAWLALVSQLRRMATAIERAEEARAGRQAAEDRAGAARAQLEQIHQRYRGLVIRGGDVVPGLIVQPSTAPGSDIRSEISEDEVEDREPERRSSRLAGRIFRSDLDEGTPLASSVSQVRLCSGPRRGASVASASVSCTRLFADRHALGIPGISPRGLKPARSHGNPKPIGRSNDLSDGMSLALPSGGNP